jgi:hypothetical protein
MPVIPYVMGRINRIVVLAGLDFISKITRGKGLEAA